MAKIQLSLAEIAPLLLLIGKLLLAVYILLCNRPRCHFSAGESDNSVVKVGVGCPVFPFVMPLGMCLGPCYKYQLMAEGVSWI